MPSQRLRVDWYRYSAQLSSYLAKYPSLEYFCSRQKMKSKNVSLYLVICFERGDLAIQ